MLFFSIFILGLSWNVKSVNKNYMDYIPYNIHSIYVSMSIWNHHSPDYLLVERLLLRLAKKWAQVTIWKTHLWRLKVAI